MIVVAIMIVVIIIMIILIIIIMMILIIIIKMQIIIIILMIMMIIMEITGVTENGNGNCTNNNQYLSLCSVCLYVCNSRSQLPGDQPSQMRN